MASLLAALASARAVREVSGSGLFQKPVRSERRLSRRLIGPHVDEAGASSPTEIDFDSVAAGAALLAGSTTLGSGSIVTRAASASLLAGSLITRGRMIVAGTSANHGSDAWRLV